MTTTPLHGKVAFITGGAGLLGVRHAEAIARAGGVPVLADVRIDAARAAAADIGRATGVAVLAVRCDVSDEASVIAAAKETKSRTIPSVITISPSWTTKVCLMNWIKPARSSGN